MNRRTFLARAGQLTGAATATSFLGSCQSVPEDSPSRSALRLAHITDSHVTDLKTCHENMARFLRAFGAIKPAPDLVIHTGDVIMDALGPKSRAQVLSQWDIWRQFASAMPAMRYCIGNHDIWADELDDTPLSGKRHAMDELKLHNPYYSFDHGGWTFLMLDSSRPGISGGNIYYEARLDDLQREWLLAELKRIPSASPLAVCSHIPILSAGVHEWAKLRSDAPDSPSKGKSWITWASLMHNDTAELQSALRGRTGTTLCLSGHLHLQDHVVYDGVYYLGNGAVSADWWKRAVFHQTKAGFAILDLHPDGRWERTYHHYDWLA